jgi:hypothetical protein
MLQHSGSQAVTPQMLSKFARTARQRIRLEGGGYRRDPHASFSRGGQLSKYICLPGGEVCAGSNPTLSARTRRQSAESSVLFYEEDDQSWPVNRPSSQVAQFQVAPKVIAILRRDILAEPSPIVGRCQTNDSAKTETRDETLRCRCIR